MREENECKRCQRSGVIYRAGPYHGCPPPPNGRGCRRRLRQFREGCDFLCGTVIGAAFWQGV